MSKARQIGQGSALAGIAAIVMAVAMTACWLDLDALTSGNNGPSGGAGGSGTSSGSAGGSVSGDSVLLCDPCPAGGCAADTVAQGNTVALFPADVAVGPGGLYWVNQDGGQLMRFGKGDAAPVELSTAPHPRSLAVGDGVVYFTADSGVFSCAGACGPAKTKLASAAAVGTLGRVAFDGASIYWSDRGTSPSGGSVFGCDPMDCTLPKLYGDNLYLPDDIETGAGHIFWAERGDNNSNGEVIQGSPSGALTIIAGGLSLPTSVAATSDWVYYPQWASGGAIYRCAPNIYCGSPQKVFPGKTGEAPFDIAVGGGRVYWSDTQSGSIQSCNASGCGANEPVVHVSGRTGLTRIALGQSCIFWVDAMSGGSIGKVGR